jgi:YD repeat-containing protein
MSFLSCFIGSSLGYDNRGRIISYYSHNSEFIYNLSYLRNSNVLQQELYGSYRDYFANTEDLVYKYTYDKSNRLLSATNTAGSSNEYKVENSYDKDGNILTMKRYVDAGNMQDNFTYQYYSGTNKLSRVSGNVDQFRYDLNGNMITDSVYNNFSISYDHRNLITELYHIDTLTSTRQYSYATSYSYDEAGNRVRKLTYRNAQIPPPQINDWGNPGNGWTLLNNEHYIRGVDGKELATYTSNNLTEWYVWASDMVGKIRGNAKYFFFKDHLSSVRAVVDNNFNLISAVDGACPRVLLAEDMWGDKMQGRIYKGDSAKFGFTGKEEDGESYYDCFGAMKVSPLLIYQRRND